MWTGEWPKQFAKNCKHSGRSSPVRHHCICNLQKENTRSTFNEISNCLFHKYIMFSKWTQWYTEFLQQLIFTQLVNDISKFMELTTKSSVFTKDYKWTLSRASTMQFTASQLIYPRLFNKFLLFYDPVCPVVSLLAALETISWPHFIFLLYVLHVPPSATLISLNVTFWLNSNSVDLSAWMLGESSNKSFPFPLKI